MTIMFILYIWKKDKVIDNFATVIGEMKETFIEVKAFIKQGNKLNEEILRQSKDDREHFNEKINKAEGTIIDKVTQTIHESIPRKR